MNSRHAPLRVPGGRLTVSILAAIALVAVLFSYLGGAVAGAAPAAQSGTPAPEATPVATTTPVAESAAGLPAEAQAALDAFLASTEGAGLAAADDLPVGLTNSFSYVHLPALIQAPGTGQGPVTPTPPTETPVLKTADVSVRLWSDPSIRVIRGGNFTYELRVRNHGQGSASQVKVTLPYRRDQYTLLEANFDNSKGDWVSEIADKTITITFGRLAPNSERTGRITFRVASNLADETVLDMRATYGWSDAGNGARDRQSNWAPLLVGAGNASAPWVWTVISPTSGPASTVFRVQSNRFIPGEQVVTWLNTPHGVQALNLRGTANALGAVDLSLQDSKLPAGNYQIVLYGQRSGLTGVASFTIR